MKPVCPYCQKPAQMVNGRAIYPHRTDLFRLVFWQCAPCDAYVGCHLPAPRGLGDGTVPLGRLANAELRRARQQDHAAFDPLWRARHMNRRQAYAWLARQLGARPWASARSALICW